MTEDGAWSYLVPDPDRKDLWVFVFPNKYEVVVRGYEVARGYKNKNGSPHCYSVSVHKWEESPSGDRLYTAGFRSIGDIYLDRRLHRAETVAEILVAVKEKPSSR